MVAYAFFKINRIYAIGAEIVGCYYPAGMNSSNNDICHLCILLLTLKNGKGKLYNIFILQPPGPVGS